MTERKLDVIVDGLFQCGPWYVERVHVPIGTKNEAYTIKWVAKMDLEGAYMAQFDHLYEASQWVKESFRTIDGQNIME